MRTLAAIQGYRGETPQVVRGGRAREAQVAVGPLRCYVWVSVRRKRRCPALGQPAHINHLTRRELCQCVSLLLHMSSGCLSVSRRAHWHSQRNHCCEQMPADGVVLQHIDDGDANEAPVHSTYCVVLPTVVFSNLHRA